MGGLFGGMRGRGSRSTDLCRAIPRSTMAARDRGQMLLMTREGRGERSLVATSVHRSPVSLQRKRLWPTFLDRLCGGERELIASFVFGVSCMAFDPSGGDLVSLALFRKRLPEVLILHWFAACGSPALGNPVLQPHGESVGDIFAVGEEVNPGGLFEGLECCEDGSNFHALVG